MSRLPLARPADSPGKYFHVEPAVASYPSAVGILFAGMGAFFWVPLANVFGRRPILIFTLLMTCAFTAWGGSVSSSEDGFRQLYIARAFSGFAAAASPALCIAIVCDLFCVRRRSRARLTCPDSRTRPRHRRCYSPSDAGAAPPSPKLV